MLEPLLRPKQVLSSGSESMWDVKTLSMARSARSDWGWGVMLLCGVSKPK